MTHRRAKTVYFVIEGGNSFAVVFYVYYLFFLLHSRYGFDAKSNLLAAALHGLTYFGVAWLGGRFAQRYGYFKALRFGFSGMALALLFGSALPYMWAQMLVLASWTAAMSFTWPGLEALICEGESPDRLSQMVGRYNGVWAGTAAVAYFTGGALFERLGVRSIYWLPIGIHLLQLGTLAWLSRHVSSVHPASTASGEPPLHAPDPAALPQPVSPKTFMRMAWFANPFAYIVINTVVAVMPQVAAKFGLSPTETGLFCSLWLFLRLAAFVLLWQWSGWHYRFRWLLGAFIGLIVSFATMLLAEKLWLVIASQIFMGPAVGFLYYSSLFYSMDVGETKGEHGGFHESALGLGIFVGPAIGAAALHFFPQWPHAGTWAASGLLLIGLAGLAAMRMKHRQ